MRDSSGNRFGMSTNEVSPSEPKPGPDSAAKLSAGQDPQTGAPYKKGDFIGQKYEVYGVLGSGGLGIVYLVYSHEAHEVYALKTFQDKFLADPRIRSRFHKEASVWIQLESHPYLVSAKFVEEVSGRLYIAMEPVARNEAGLNSLDGYLQRRPPDLAQSLRWAIQICFGMEYAYSKGLRAHRDLKPANIMITQDGTAKITDFGLAALGSEAATEAADLGARQGAPGPFEHTLLGQAFGTPTHMAPEQFDNAAGCDQRSDIYSFGIVLYQLASRGTVPFLAPNDAHFWEAMRWMHRTSPVPRLDSSLFPIIHRCLEKLPAKRYQAFKEVRRDLEPLLLQQTGEMIIPATPSELGILEWYNQGFSLRSLGRYEEAITCYDKALELEPRLAWAWNNKGEALQRLGRSGEALPCHDKALELDPRLAEAWSAKGTALASLGRHEEATHCYDEAAVAWSKKGNALAGQGRHEEAVAWSNKGNALASLGRHEEAITCYDKALELDAQYAYALYNKGHALGDLGRHEEATRCFDQALEFDPHLWGAWYRKGLSLGSMGRSVEATRCYDRALEGDPRLVAAWLSKAVIEEELTHIGEAARCYQKFLALAPAVYGQEIEIVRRRLQELGVEEHDEPRPPDSPSADSWNSRGIGLQGLGQHEEAIRCFDIALGLDPRLAVTWCNKASSLCSLGRFVEASRCCDGALLLELENAVAWYTKGLAEDGLNDSRQAVHCYNQFLTLSPPENTIQFEHARKRLQELAA
jgi:eukaryotic-like serine/threonine-protein kinase